MTNDYRIIDALCYLPTAEVLLDLIISMPPEMSGYLDVFEERMAVMYGVKAAELKHMKMSLSEHELKEALLPQLRDKAATVGEFVKHLDGIGVEKAVIFNMDEESVCGIKGLANDYFAEIVRRYPDKFIGVAGIDPFKGMAAVREIRRCFDLGLRGIAFRPFMFGLPPHHAKFYPLYSTCVELDIPVWLHMSVNHSSKTMEVERPIYLDIVCQDFPDLKVIAGHGGWPWVNELIAVAWRNPNVYLDISGYLPKYFAQAGSGWEPLLTFGNSILQDRVLFGSVWLNIGVPIKDLAEGVIALPLKEEVKRKWLYDNAASLFGVV